MRKTLEKNIRNVTPYVPGEQPKGRVVKLNTNENPYPPAPGVGRVLASMDTDRLRLYPDPDATPLRQALARQYQVKPEQVFVGSGSDEVLSLCFLTFFNSGKPVLFPDITYSFYPVWARLYGIPYECPKLDENFRLVKEDYDLKVSGRENGGIIFPNPNAPTGLYEDLSVIEEILQKNPDVIVILDEAYIDFGGASALPLIEKYDNLIVVQTFSKSRSLAGMRIGYAVSSPDLIRCLTDVKYSFNSYPMNQAAIACGVEAVKDTDYFNEGIRKITKTREWARSELENLGFICLDSRANFLFVTHPGYRAEDLFEALKADGIYVRYWDSPRIDNYLRITIGTPEDMQALFDSLRAIMK